MSKDNFTDLFPSGALEGVLPVNPAAPHRPEKLHGGGHACKADIAPERHIYRISQLLSGIRDTLDMEFNPIWVQGEISGFSRAASGHCYFSLRESSSMLKCVMFRGSASSVGFRLEDGLHVNCHGSLNIYSGRGDLQIVVDRMEQAGEGLLFAELERLRKQLENEGLFDPALKKSIPAFPERIFLVTSPAGAAVRDFIRTARGRWAGVDIILVPTIVQGASAAPEIIAAVKRSDLMASRGDVIVITRGGGALEDLWAFNEEDTVRAVARCSTPVISAIGHETDFTILDHVADIRAATPTAAAAAATPEACRLREQVTVFVRRAGRATGHIITSGRHKTQLLTHGLKDPGSRLFEQRQRLDEMMLRLEYVVNRIISSNIGRLEHLLSGLQLHSPVVLIETMSMKLQSYSSSLYQGMNYTLSAGRTNMEHAASRLDSVSPLSILARGYSLVHDQTSGRLIKDPAGLKRGDRLIIIPHSGTILCRVLDTGDTDSVNTGHKQGHQEDKGQ